ncbi:MAG: winged helix-turn-helix domain-containing protein [Defluviitaleaceae bacterium]|nr:winged helix-turn-helix domain-containing protein [Defluviitaleaceae bacterium]
MKIAYLAIENDLTTHERESKFWLSRGIDSIRVSNMNEGIDFALKTKFYFIGINATNINYLPKLIHLRTVTSVPIFISTSDDLYCTAEQSKAIQVGADLYGIISENPAENYDTCVAMINRLQKRATEQQWPSHDVVVSRNILMSCLNYQAFYGDKIIELSKTEFDLMFYFITHQEVVFTAEQLYNHIWKDVSVSQVTPAIKNIIKRLRQKFENPHVIENVYGSGYKFAPR